MAESNLKLELKITSQEVLPEIVSTLKSMIDVFNQEHSEALYVKLLSDSKEGCTVRHHKFDNSDKLLLAIEMNCPVGCEILYVIQQ